MADLTQTLIAASSADRNAERALREFEERNLPEFVVCLARELATEGKDMRARQLAGLHLKNRLVAIDDALQTAKHNAWKNLPPEVRQNVKASLLTALRSLETVARHTAAQAAAEVASIELPYNEWPDFLPTVLENVKSQPEGVTIASLECLGFACERISVLDELPPIDEKTTDAMLTAIVDGIQKTRPEPVRLAASIALRNSLIFADKNMERKPERDAIMNNICEATQSTHPQVRTVAFECITQLAAYYYDKLGDYMTAIFQLTMDAIRRDEEAVAKQAIEFWCTLCEVEIEMLDEADDLVTQALPVERPCARYVAGAVEHLGPVLLATLTKQDEDVDTEDEHYNVSMASATCLSFVAKTVEDLVIPVVMPFVTANIQNENWRLREAATMAFASILEGTSADGIGGVVNQSIPVLLNALSDSHVMIRDTSAFAIAVICELHIRSIPLETLPLLVNGLMSKLLTESTRVSAQACSALHNLASAFDGDDSSLATGTNALSQYIPALLETLLKTADREDADAHNLRAAAIEALSVLVQYSAPDVQPVLLQLLPVVVQRLHVSFSIQAVTQEDRDRKEGLQGLWCALIQVLCQKVTQEGFAPHADAVMSNLLTVLQSKNATSHSEAFSAISAVADKMEGGFEKYMPTLQPFLIDGLKNYEAYFVCIVAIGLVGDVARVLEEKVQPYCNEIMGALIDVLKEDTVHRNVKPVVFATFGEIAMAIEAAYEPYVQYSLMLLLQAAIMQAPSDDEEFIEYINILRDSILEAYSGIIQGLSGGNRIDLFLPYAQSVLQFLHAIAEDPNRDEYVLSRAVGLVGDVASTMGPHLKNDLNQPHVAQLLQEAEATGDEKTMETAQWTRGIIEGLIRGN